MYFSRIREFYAEIIAGIVCSFACIYFIYNLNENRNQRSLLIEVESKLMLAEVRKKRILEQRIAQRESVKEDPVKYFRSCLQYVGFKVLKIEEDETNFKALVIKDTNFIESEKQLSNILDGINKEEIDGKMFITWQMNEIETKSNSSAPILQGIMFIDKNNWQVWLNGKLYEPSNRNVDQETRIESVDSDCIILSTSAGPVELFVD